MLETILVLVVIIPLLVEIFLKKKQGTKNENLDRMYKDKIILAQKKVNIIVYLMMKININC